MKFKREVFSDYYLRDTHIENIFINEYMPYADGSFVKVYTFALMYAGYDSKMSNEIIAKQLHMDILDVLKAWDYWEKKGVIKKSFADPADRFNYIVEFINLKELLYGKAKKEKKQDYGISEKHKSLLENQEIKNMYSDIEQISGRLIDSNEARELISIISESDISPSVIINAYTYCSKKRNNTKPKYVASVIKEWVNQGIKTTEQANDFLEETDNRHFMYKKILKSLGLFRHPTDEEKRIVDTWFDELGFDIETITQACNKTSGISNPNLNYINSVLKGWKSGDKGQGNKENPLKSSEISRVIKSYEEAREKNKSENEKRRNEIISKLPRIKKIEDETRDESLKLSKILLYGVKGNVDSKKIQDTINKLNEEKAFLLTENNYSIKYLEPIYDCQLCQDTGMLENGERCQCFTIKLTNISNI
jgi:DnaD/phage-associated family protein